MNCGDCKRFDKEDSYCDVMKMTVANPSWDKPCVQEYVKNDDTNKKL